MAHEEDREGRPTAENLDDDDDLGRTRVVTPRGDSWTEDALEAEGRIVKPEPDRLANAEAVESGDVEDGGPRFGGNPVRIYMSDGNSVEWPVVFVERLDGDSFFVTEDRMDWIRADLVTRVAVLKGDGWFRS